MYSKFRETTENLKSTQIKFKENPELIPSFGEFEGNIYEDIVSNHRPENRTQTIVSIVKPSALCPSGRAKDCQVNREKNPTQTVFQFTALFRMQHQFLFTLPVCPLSMHLTFGVANSECM